MEEGLTSRRQHKEVFWTIELLYILYIDLCKIEAHSDIGNKHMVTKGGKMGEG